MTNKEILDQLRKTPFVPFLLLTADGREYRVRHPELIAIGPTSRTCAVVAEDNHIATLDVRLITAVKELDPEGDAGASRESA
jgi:hypothetical protein